MKQMSQAANPLQSMWSQPEMTHLKRARLLCDCELLHITNLEPTSPYWTSFKRDEPFRYMWQLIPCKSSSVAAGSNTVLHRGESFVLVNNKHADAITVRVLVPSYGVCMADRSAVVLVSDESSAPSEGGSPGLRKLKVKTFDRDFIYLQGFVPLVRLVGPALTHIAVDKESYDDSFKDSHLQIIIDACPLLRHVAITNCELNLQLVVDAYEIHHRRWSSLLLSGLSVESSDVRAFAQALGESSSRISRTLRQLVLEYGRPSHDDWLEFRRMLQVNRVLNFIKISQPDRPLHGPITWGRKPEEIECVHVAASDIPFQSKMAFLGVVYAQGKRS